MGEASARRINDDSRGISLGEARFEVLDLSDDELRILLALQRGISLGESDGFASALDADELRRMAREPENAHAAVEVDDFRGDGGACLVFLSDRAHELFADFGVHLVEAAYGHFKDALKGAFLKCRLTRGGPYPPTDA